MAADKRSISSVFYILIILCITAGFAGIYAYSVRHGRVSGAAVSGDGYPAFWLLCVVAVLWSAAAIARLAAHRRRRHYRIRQQLGESAIEQSMNTFTGFLDARDSYTRGHSVRVASYAAELARRMGLDAEEIRRIYYITLMHDCGKIGVPDAVLKKEGRLTPAEFEIIKAHTTMGDNILVNFTAVPGIRDGAHYHHEHYDGTGYPEGLAGTDIPLCARIICVADSYDAMSTDRCYRSHLARREIIGELLANSGKQFDPGIVRHMVDMICDGFTDDILLQYPDEQELAAG